ncbi:MAG: hypothetical protein WDZ46_09550 [Solirubrobacterales bacterium]
MAWTPEQLHGQMLRQIRQEALELDASPRRLAGVRRQWSALQRRLPGRGQLTLIVLITLLIAGWLLVMVAHWPPGGGKETSGLVYTQGASLVFVVILLSLLNGPLTAGQKLGWDSGWVARDTLVWSGLAMVALLSLLLLWLGWVRPERAEEGGSILLTGAGLALTALIARRLVYLSDPGNQLEARLKQQLPKVIKILDQEQHRAAKAIRRQTSPVFRKRLELYPVPPAQEGVRGVLFQFVLLTQRSVHEGSWDLAIRAHDASVRLVKEYVSQAGALEQEDAVVNAFGEKSEDLHAVSGAPSGRLFSQHLITGMKEIAMAVAARQFAADLSRIFGSGADTGPLHAIQYRLEHMLKRRIADPDSADAAHCSRVLGDIGAAYCQIGDPWMGIGTQKALLRYALMATKGGLVHLAGPCWQEAVRILAAVALADPGSDRHAFAGASDALVDTVDDLPRFPSLLQASGLEPVFGIVPAPNKMSLQEASHIVWASEGPELEDLSKWTWRLTHSCLSLLRRTEDVTDDPNPRHSSHWASQELAETIHQFSLAAASRAQSEAESRVEIADLLRRQLETLRVFMISPQGSQGDRAVGEILHRYVTDFIVAIFVIQGQDGIEQLIGELSKMDSAITEDTIEALPRGFGEGMRRVADALERVGCESDAAKARAIADRASTAGPRDDSAIFEALQMGFHLHRGNLVVPIVEEAETWLMRDTPSAAECETEVQP